jgi:ATP-dependent DNA helicase RecG
MPERINYSDAELETMLDERESDSVELKESWAGDAPEKGRQAICAFANDLPNHEKPGVLIVGARDDGTPSGIEISDELLKTLADIKSDGNMLPPPTIIVQKRRLKGADMAVVIVHSADAPPVRYKGRIWIRIGPRRGLASVQDERILNEKRRHKDVYYEMRPVSRSSISDLNKLLFEQKYLPRAFAEDVLNIDQRTYEQRLAVCGMVESYDNPIPTILGLLVLGDNPRHFIPSGYIQFLRINGNEFSDPVIDEELIEGDLARFLSRVDDKLSAHNRVHVDITSSPIEKRTYLFPMEALQQIIRNAVMHRNYEGTNAPVRIYWFNNRIEIISPGGPFGAVTPANFGSAGLADYRNPRLADTMKVLGFVQRFGVGIQIAQRAMRDNGNPPIEFKVDENWVKCILKVHPGMKVRGKRGAFIAPVNAPVNAPLTELQRAILTRIAEEKSISYDALAVKLEKNRSTIMRNIRALKDMGILKRIGSDKKGHWEIVNNEKAG